MSGLRINPLQPESVGEFNFVVLGAGSAGCVVAARRRESGKYSMALAEAGGEDNHFWIQAPLGFGGLCDDKRFNSCYDSEPELELHGA